MKTITTVLNNILTCSKILLNVSAAMMFLAGAKFIAMLGNEFIFWFA